MEKICTKIYIGIYINGGVPEPVDEVVMFLCMMDFSLPDFLIE